MTVQKMKPGVSRSGGKKKVKGGGERERKDQKWKKRQEKGRKRNKCSQGTRHMEKRGNKHKPDHEEPTQGKENHENLRASGGGHRKTGGSCERNLGGKRAVGEGKPNDGGGLSFEKKKSAKRGNPQITPGKDRGETERGGENSRGPSRRKAKKKRKRGMVQAKKPALETALKKKGTSKRKHRKRKRERLPGKKRAMQG